MTVANTNIILNDNVTEEQKNIINNNFEKVYKECHYINSTGFLQYQGDMGCLCVLATKIVENLFSLKLIPCISKFEVISKNDGYTEDMIDDEFKLLQCIKKN